MFLHPEIETEDSKRPDDCDNGYYRHNSNLVGKYSFTQETPPIPQSHKGSCHDKIAVQG